MSKRASLRQNVPSKNLWNTDAVRSTQLRLPHKRHWKDIVRENDEGRQRREHTQNWVSISTAGILDNGALRLEREVSTS